MTQTVSVPRRRRERQNTTAGWAASTEPLLLGEIGVWTDTLPAPKLKVGDGVTLPVDLPWFSEGAPGAPGGPGAAGPTGLPGALGAKVLASLGAPLTSATVPNSTTTEVTVWSGVIPAATVAPGDVLPIMVNGGIKTSGTGNTPVTFRLRLGTTILAQAAAINFTPSTQFKNFLFTGQLVVGATVASQTAGGLLAVATHSSESAQLLSAGFSVVALTGTSPAPTENMALARTFSLTAEIATTATTTGLTEARSASVLHTQVTPTVELVVTATTEQMEDALAAGLIEQAAAAAIIEVDYKERDTTPTPTTGEADVPGFAISVPGNLGRPIVVEAGGGNITHSAGGEVDLFLYESVNGGTFTLKRVWDDQPPSAGEGGTRGKARLPASTDERAYKVAVRTQAGSGTATWTMSPTRPGYFTVYQL